MPGVPVPPGYVRPDPEPHPDLPPPRKSRICKLKDGSQKTYPSLSDYVEQYVSQGIIKDLDDLIQNYGHLLGELFFNWVRTGQLGCLFAVQLAKEPRRNRWLPIVQLQPLAEGSRLSDFLNTQLDAASERNEAAAVILPEIRTAEDIVALVNVLCQDPSGRWYWTKDGIDQTDSSCMIGLRWQLPQGKSVNFVLGFADIDSMPQTRRSPFTALFLRISDVKRTPIHREDGLVQVHLADLDSTFYPQELHDQVWELTRRAREQHVEDHMTMAARARITFTIPIEHAAGLCPARSVKIEKEA